MAATLKGKKAKEYWTSEEGCVRVEGWARNGLTQEQIAKEMEISISTLVRWRKNPDPIFDGLREALKVTKDYVDKQVENALFQSAMGYEWEEVTEEWKFNPLKGKHEMIVTKKVKKRVAPSNAAQIFWLKNRRPDDWRDKRYIEDKVEFENDGFIDALKGQAEDTFKDAGDIVEE